MSMRSLCPFVGSFVVIAVLVLGGCLGTDGDSGDGEFSDSSGSSGGGTGVAAGCSELNANSCAGESLCIGGVCESAFPRRYRLSVFSASVPSQKDDGSAWDILGGAPDLFALIWVNNDLVGQTVTASDTFDASWNEAFLFELVAGDQLTVEVLDEDAAANDPVNGCEYGTVTGQLLRGRDLSCATSTGDFDLVVTIEPN